MHLTKKGSTGGGRKAAFLSRIIALFCGVLISGAALCGDYAELASAYTLSQEEGTSLHGAKEAQKETAAIENDEEEGPAAEAEAEARFAGLLESNAEASDRYDSPATGAMPTPDKPPKYLFTILWHKAKELCKNITEKKQAPAVQAGVEEPKSPASMKVEPGQAAAPAPQDMESKKEKPAPAFEHHVEEKTLEEPKPPVFEKIKHEPAAAPEPLAAAGSRKINPAPSGAMFRNFYLAAFLVFAIYALVSILRFLKKLGKMKESETKYLNRSVLLKEGNNPFMSRIIIWFSAVAILGFIVWAANMELDEIAIANGEIIPTTNVQQMQHPSGGIVTEILVKDGELVKKDQVLMRLDPIAAESQMDQTTAQLRTLTLQRERLKSFINIVSGRGGLALDLANNNDESGLIGEQARILRNQVDSYRSGRQALEFQNKQLQAELNQLDEEEKTYKQEKEIYSSEESIKKKLMEEGLFSKLEFLNVQRKISDINGALEQMGPKRNRINEKINEIRERLKEYNSEIIKTNSMELVDIDAKIAQLREVMKRNEQSYQLLNVRAPVDGVIHGLTKHTIGGVINPSEIFMRIVPKDSSLAAEVQITSKDSGHVTLGQRAILKLTAYNYGRYGGITGVLKDISATTFMNAAGQPFYKGTIVLDKNYIGSDPNSNNVLPGMTLEANIKTGSKTVLEYLLKPIFTSAENALHER